MSIVFRGAYRVKKEWIKPELSASTVALINCQSKLTIMLKNY